MFKENFIRLCNQKGVPPTQVCKAIGLTASSYSQWSDETVPRKATLIKIADYFGVTVDYLLGKTEETKKLPASNEELVEMIRQMNQGKAQIFFCGADGKVVDVPPEAESLILNLIETLDKNKK